MKHHSEHEKESIHETVRDAYATRVKGGGCCEPTSCCAPATADGSAAESARHRDSALQMGYSAEDLESVPEGANLGLGCGAPLAAARVKPGETVLDLGSGAGFDAFIAARETGPEGRVIGIDMTPEMIEQARKNAQAAAVNHVEFRQGFIEELPVKDETVDVLISNCVINLSPDKPAVFREAFRVLRPGGRIAVSDIVLTAPLPQAIEENIVAYVGCVAGAPLLDDYLGYIRAAGFQDVGVVESRQAVDALSEDDPVVQSVLDGIGEECTTDLSAEIKDVAGRILSAKITARKPIA